MEIRANNKKRKKKKENEDTKHRRVIDYVASGQRMAPTPHTRSKTLSEHQEKSVHFGIPADVLGTSSRRNVGRRSFASLVMLAASGSGMKSPTLLT